MYYDLRTPRSSCSHEQVSFVAFLFHVDESGHGANKAMVREFPNHSFIPGNNCGHNLRAWPFVPGILPYLRDVRGALFEILTTRAAQLSRHRNYEKIQ